VNQNVACHIGRVPAEAEDGTQVFFEVRTYRQPLKMGDKVRFMPRTRIGPGVSPKTALSVGLKVDADAIPSAACGQDQGRPEIEALG